MKNNLLLFYFFISTLICRDFDILMSIYSDVWDNNVLFFVSPHPDNKIIENHPISFSIILDDSLIDSRSFGERSYARVPIKFKDSMHLEEGIAKLAGKIIKAPSKLRKYDLNVSDSIDFDKSIYEYTFSISKDSILFQSKNFKNKKRDFKIDFYSRKKNQFSSDSINVKIDFYSPILDSDLRYYKDYYTDSSDFKKITKNQIKKNGEPLFSTFIKLPSSSDFRGASSIRFAYKNPKSIILVGSINDNKKTAQAVSQKQKTIPTIILATILLIMVIFIVILVLKQIIRNRKERT